MQDLVLLPLMTLYGKRRVFLTQVTSEDSELLQFIFRDVVDDVQKVIFRQVDDLLSQNPSSLKIANDLKLRLHGLIRVGFDYLADDLGVQLHVTVEGKDGKGF